MKNKLMKTPQTQLKENNFPNFCAPTTLHDYNALYFYILYIIIINFHWIISILLHSGTDFTWIWYMLYEIS